ncbi:MAG: hypothetical protein Q7S04_00760 [Candidatus Moranbacteria bacterium]|nr:hypothetical protein [Candidatus Moranbacteria bacterium]
MKILFVSGELIAGDVAYRLKKEGCEVKLFIEHPNLQHGLDGFIEKTSDWRKELSWVGKEGLIVFDDVGYGKEQDELRKAGYRVVGGSESGDKLELNREYGQWVLAQHGMNIIPTFNFHDVSDAIKFVSDRGGVWVVKQNSHQSALNYVGALEDGRDVINVLEIYRRNGIKNITLQEKIYGIEMSINRYFNGREWVGPSEITIEHKSLFNDNLGPKTGEMGNLMWYDDSEGKFFKETLDKLKPFLQETNFRGDIDINCFIKEDKVFPIEATSRFGCPITHSQSVMHISPWREFLEAVADGKDFTLEHKNGYCIALTIAVPPYPYEGSLDKAYSPEGLEIFFKDDCIEKEREHFHFEGAIKRIEGEKKRYFVCRSLGCVLYVTGYGKSVEEAREAVYARAKKVIIPKVFYRTDIGMPFINSDQEVLKKWGWI